MAKARAHPGAAFAEALLLQHVERGQPGAHGEAVLAEGGGVNDGAFEGAEDGVADGLAHEHRAHRNQTAGERLGENHHVGFDLKVVGGEKRSGAVHAGLHFVQHEERAVAPAEFLRGEKVARVGNADAAFGLHRLHDEGGELAGGQMLLQLVEIAER